MEQQKYHEAKGYKDQIDKEVKAFKQSEIDKIEEERLKKQEYFESLRKQQHPEMHQEHHAPPAHIQAHPQAHSQYEYPSHPQMNDPRMQFEQPAPPQYSEHRDHGMEELDQLNMRHDLPPNAKQASMTNVQPTYQNSTPHIRNPREARGNPQADKYQRYEENNKSGLKNNPLAMNQHPQQPPARLPQRDERQKPQGSIITGNAREEYLNIKKKNGTFGAGYNILSGV